jgi:4-amino-4-deoxy-L-arabinose transferase-like glycosyltransferase
MGIIVACIVIRLIVMCALQSWQVLPQERYGFRDGEIAASLAAGQGFSWPENSSYHPGQGAPTAWQAPVYPLLMGAVFKVLGTYSSASAFALLVFQILISAIVCVLLLMLGERLFYPGAGLTAACLFAFYPSALHFSAQKIESITLIVCLLLLFILQLLRLARDPNWKQGALTGIIMGVLLLSDPTMVAFLPLAAFWFLVATHGPFIKRMSVGFTLLLAAALTIAPWQIRNYRVIGHFVFIKSNLSRELFMGNYSNRQVSKEEKKDMVSLSDGERDKLYQSKFLESVTLDPARFAKRTFKRFRKFWTDLPINQGAESTPKSGIVEVIVSITYLGLLLIGVVGLALTRLKGSGVWLLFAAILSLPVPYYLTWFSRFRYRFPIEVLLIIFAAFLVCLIWKRLWGFGHDEERTTEPVCPGAIG